MTEMSDKICDPEAEEGAWLKATRLKAVGRSQPRCASFEPHVARRGVALRGVARRGAQQARARCLLPCRGFRARHACRSRTMGSAPTRRRCDLLCRGQLPHSWCNAPAGLCPPAPLPPGRNNYPTAAAHTKRTQRTLFRKRPSSRCKKLKNFRPAAALPRGCRPSSEDVHSTTREK